MWYAIAAGALSIIAGLVWLGVRSRKAGKDAEQNKHLKEGNKARERQDEKFARSRGGLVDRIAGKLRDYDRR